MHAVRTSAAYDAAHGGGSAEDVAEMRARLLPGDVLLSRSRSCIGDWMAWNAECPYSHAALVIAEGVVLDAVPPCVRLRSLDAALTEAPACIDVYRARNRDGSALTEAQRAMALWTALRLSGRPFALARMPALALRTLLRHKLSAAPQRALLQRHWRGYRDVSCCDLVFLALRAACGFALGPRLLRQQARPRLQPLRLFSEWRHTAQRRSPRKAASPAAALPSLRLPRELIVNDLLSSPQLAYLGPLVRG